MKYSREVKAGLIGLLAIVGFFMLFQIMKGKDFFSSINYYIVKYDNVEGLQKSNPVTINGLKVGMIEEINPKKNEKGEYYFEVKISVNKEYEFSKKSKVLINEPSLMSGKQLKIEVSYYPPMALNGDILNGDTQLSTMAELSSQVAPVKDQLSSVLKKVDSTMLSANKLLDIKNRNQIQALLVNLNALAKSFETTSHNAQSLINQNNSKIGKLLDETTSTMQTTKSTVGEYGKLANNLPVEKINKTLDELQELSTNMNKILEGLDKGQGTAGKALRDEELYNNLNKSVTSLNALLEDVKANPKRYIHFSVFGKK